MIHRNSLIQKVAGLVSNDVSGDTVLMIEQYIPTAIQRLSKRLVESNDPAAEHLVVERNVFPAVGQTFGYSFATLPDSYIPTIKNTLFRVVALTNDDEELLVHPVQSFAGLNLADIEKHETGYYKVDGDRMYFNLPTGISVSINGFNISHYEYLHLDNDLTIHFPDELEQFLVGELTMLVQNEQQKKAIDTVTP